MPEISFAKGQKLLLNQEAIDPQTNEKIEKNTEVKIKSVNKEGIIEVEFPNGSVWKHVWTDIIRLFSHKDTKILSTVKEGSGTPPKGFFPYLPAGADWKKNYSWKVYIQLEEIGDKEIICPVCNSEIQDLQNKNTNGDLFCKSCANYVAAYDLRKNELFNSLSTNNDVESDKVPSDKE